MKSIEALAQFDGASSPENGGDESPVDENASVDWSSIVARITALEQTVNSIQRQNAENEQKNEPKSESVEPSDEGSEEKKVVEKEGEGNEN